MTAAPRLLAIGALALGIGAAVLDWRSARQARGELRLCTAAAGDEREPLKGCPETISAAIEAQRRAAACEAAIAGADLYAERASCGEQVKRRGALLVGAEANLADARRQIAEAERRTTAAIARAEARGETQSRRADDARSAIDAAPLGADGLLSCDAQCLRRLAGAGPRG